VKASENDLDAQKHRMNSTKHLETPDGTIFDELLGVKKLRALRWK